MTACGPISALPPVGSTPSSSASFPVATPAATSAATSAPSPTPLASTRLFAALVGHPDASGVVAIDTVAIIGDDGGVRARHTFVPVATPVFGRAATLLQPDARVANGKVYFADGAGVVRALSPDGTVANVTSFPTPSQTEHELSFSVSPDGRTVIASVITLPAVISVDQFGLPQRDPNGRWLVDVYVAAAGGTARNLIHRDLGAGAYPPSNGNIQFVGWTGLGPLATLNNLWATQQGTAGRFLYGSPLVQVDGNATPGPALGGNDCEPAGFVSDGSVVCTDLNSGTLSLRNASGLIRWTVTAPSSFPLWGAAPSPNGAGVAFVAGVVNMDGSVLLTPTTPDEPVLQADGWLDLDTIIGVMACAPSQPSCGDLGMATVNGALSSVVDLGVKGRFVGAIA